MSKNVIMRRQLIIKMGLICWLSAILTANSVFPQINKSVKPGNPDDWPPECQLVYIKSSFDGKLQPAYFYKVPTSEPRPLVVSLHSWSSGYEQRDTLSWMCIAEKYNYIHPDFRGKNDNPDACGSPMAIRDIDDAISYALNNAPVSRKEVHVIGASGGGYATLMSYMTSNHDIRSFSAWVPVSDLEAWFYQSLSREPRYALEIAKVTTGTDSSSTNLSFDSDEARLRSPIFMKTPVTKRQNSKLIILAGINDGYTGSIPITQSLLFYNKVVKDFAPDSTLYLIPDADIIKMLSYRMIPADRYPIMDGRKIYYWKNYMDKVFILIFEGTHVMLPGVALNPVKSPGNVRDDE